jgi:hypothetical protein
MSLASLRSSSRTTASAPATPAPETEPVATSTGLMVAPTTPGGGILAVLASADQGGAPVFPALTVTGGAQGGLFQPHKGIPNEIADMLPQGRKPVEGVFIGYRTELSAWPAGYSERAEEGGEKVRPVWTAAAGAGDVTTAALVEKACKQYQFTKGADKHIFDHATSGVGHIRPVLQVLVWSKDLNDVLVVQSTAGYESWVESLRNLSRQADPVSGALTQFPVSIRTQSTPRQNKGNTWMVHTLTFDVPANATGGAMLKGFTEWRPTVVEEKAAQVNEWLTAEDRPVTDEIRAALVKGSTLRV